MVTSTTISDHGGAERVTRDLAAELVRTGVGVILVTSVEARVRTLGFDHRPVLNLNGKFAFLMSALRLLRIIISERLDYDIVHAHYIFPAASLCIMARILGKPLVATSHGQDLQTDRMINYGMRLDWRYALAIRTTLKFVSQHVVVSKALVGDALAAGTDSRKLRVIYNGIDLKSVPLRKAVSRTNKVRLGWLGRLHAKKNPLLAIDVFGLVLENRPDSELFVIGTGPLRDEVSDRVAALNTTKSVHLLGACSEQTKWDTLLGCSVFIMTSRLEAFGIALVEAMAAGIPCVAANLPPLSEIVQDGITGLLARPEAGAIAEQVLTVAADARLASLFAMNARRRVSEFFSASVMSEAYNRLYRSVSVGS